MQRKVCGLFLIALALIGGISVLQSSPYAAAEYACGTYGAGDFSSDCPDDSTTTTPPSNPTATPSNPTTTPSSESPVDSLPTSPIDTTSTNPASGITPIDQPAIATASPKSTNWLPVIISGTVGIIAIAAAIFGIYKIRSRKH